MKMKRLVVGSLLAGLAVAALATPASAHNVLISTSPKAGSSVATGPAKVTFNFDAPVQHGDDTIVVIGPNGTHWEKTSVATVLGDSVSTTVGPLGPAGVYTASYHIISADGHAVTGDMTFTLTKAGTGQPVAASAVSSTGTGSGGGGVPVWVWIVIAIVVLGGVLYFALRTGRQATAEGRPLQESRK
jgi:methionine-rich copper-binding protein CopC